MRDKRGRKRSSRKIGKEGKTIFIKEHMSRNIDFASESIKAAIPFHSRMIAQENTSHRFGLKFVRSVWFEPWKTLTAKNSERRKIRNGMKQNFIRRFIVNDTIRHAIDKKDNHSCGIKPIK